MNIVGFFKKQNCLVFLIPLLCSFHQVNSQSINPPTCYGGNRLLKEFIQEEMIYPSQALQAGVEGTVELEFIVKKNGSVTNIRVVRKISKAIDAEAIHIFNKILWHPATEIGIPISYKHSIEIKFKISKYMKICKQRGYDFFEWPYKPIDSSNLVHKMEQIDKYPKPIFKDKEMNFGKFIATELKYPEDAFKGDVSGTVKLRFVVEPNGRISNIEIINAVGGGCTEEAIRVIKKIKWFPGIKDNVAVRTFLPLNLQFDIAKKSVGGSIPSPGQLK